MKYEITCCKLFFRKSMQTHVMLFETYIEGFDILDVLVIQIKHTRNTYIIPITWIILLIPSKSNYLGYTSWASIACICYILCLRYIHVSSTSACQEIHMPYCRKSSLVYLWILHEQKACLTTAVRWRFLQGYINM